MIMAIVPISSLVSSISQITAPSLQPGRGAAANGADVGSGDSFGSVLSKQLDKLSSAQNKADQLAVKAATGDLQSIQDYTIASTEAQLLTQLTVSVRNKAVEAFNDIMRMQI
jgi:flagellar hook-basal body complex protein FliE